MKLTYWEVAVGAGLVWLLSRVRGAAADVLPDNAFVSAAKRVAERFGVTLEVAVIAMVINGDAAKSGYPATEIRNGKVAVGSVMRNRVRLGWAINYLAAATKKDQFEPVSNCIYRAQQSFCDSMEGVAPDIVAIAQAVYNGSVNDPTLGATNFYSPKTQAALG